MSVKSELRKEYKIIRKNVQNKAEKDKLINNYLLNFELFDKCNQVLFYAALDDEVNLDLSVKKSLEKEKKVALPVCIDNRGKMQYYYIRSFDDIEVGAFGVREPKVDFCKPLDSFSNAICIVKSGVTLAIGGGQTSRVWALENAIHNNPDKDFNGAVLASDAFFPFNDCVQVAADAGIKAIIQPGGSIRDKDSIDLCNKLNIPMVFSGYRHFRH